MSGFFLNAGNTFTIVPAIAIFAAAIWIIAFLRFV